MYKFTNGLVVFDKETRDQFIKAGYTLVETKQKVKEEIVDEDKTNDRIIEDKPRTSKKVSKRV